MVIWITGISGAGKTTLSNAIARMFKPRIPELVQIDGDEIRELFGANLSFEESGRREQINRIQRLAHMLDRQDILVLVSALYGHPDLFAWNRENFSEYFEIYIEAPLELVQRRDPKSLYRKASTGEMPNVVGLDIPWHAPVLPDMRINADLEENVDALALRVAQHIPRLAGCLESGNHVAQSDTARKS
jgi:adenylylsulfate kinase-like enzyme